MRKVKGRDYISARTGRRGEPRVVWVCRADHLFRHVDFLITALNLSSTP